MASAWIEHVKQYAAKKGITYKEAMSLARASYHKGAAPAKKAVKARKEVKAVKARKARK